jgi:hypothetical protein
MDLKEVQEKAIPLKVISLIECVRGTEIQRATGQLIIEAFFYACLSCDYLKVQGPEDKKTKQLALGNLAFYKDNKRIPNSSSNLSSSNRLAITFEMQKNGRKLNTITQWKTNDPILYPVVQWAALVTRISAYNGASDATPVSAV